MAIGVVMGRKSKLTDKARREILQVISVGGSKSLACKHAGITLPTLLNWIKRGEESKRGLYHDFLLEFRQAEARPDLMAMGIVHRAVKDGDVSAAKWWLEKKTGWGQKDEPQVQIAITPENMSVTQLLQEVEEVSQNLTQLSPPVIDLDEE
jgi:hypothetical protein